MDDAAEITRILDKLRQGDKQSRDLLFQAVLTELRRLAARKMAGERADHTLQTTALVNEAYLRLVGGRQIAWQNRAHFFSVAATVMRHVLVDHARSRGAGKRGGKWQKVELDEVAVVSQDRLEQVLDVDQLLNQLKQVDSRMSRIVELRFFGGLTETEIAEVMSISERTVRRDWKMARAWMRSQLREPPQNEA